MGNHEGHFRFSISPDEHGRVVPGCVGGEGGGEAHEEEAEQEEEPLEAGALQEIVASDESESKRELWRISATRPIHKGEKVTAAANHYN